MTGSADYRSRLIAARERLKLTSREMAERLLTPRQTYEQWEAGSRRTPGVAVVAAENIPNGRPRIDWHTVLLRAREDEKCGADLARELRLSEAAVCQAQHKFGITLPKIQGRRRMPQ